MKLATCHNWPHFYETRKIAFIYIYLSHLLAFNAMILYILWHDTWKLELCSQRRHKMCSISGKWTWHWACPSEVKYLYFHHCLPTWLGWQRPAAIYQPTWVVRQKNIVTAHPTKNDYADQEPKDHIGKGQQQFTQPTNRINPSSHRRGGTISKDTDVLEDTKIWSWVPTGP